jgi:hypothetical protein
VYLTHCVSFWYRAATRHSQAASNAFLRGDHVAAKELSLRAQEERSTAEKLNNKAAEEIFHIRNSNNSIWKIDMHGLHASEAVAALERHLHMLEFQPPGNSPASTDQFNKSEPTIADSNEVPAEKVVVFLRPRQFVLEVITGNILSLYYFLYLSSFAVYIHNFLALLSLHHYSLFF